MILFSWMYFDFCFRQKAILFQMNWYRCFFIVRLNLRVDRCWLFCSYYRQLFSCGHVVYWEICGVYKKRQLDDSWSIITLLQDGLTSSFRVNLFNKFHIIVLLLQHSHSLINTEIFSMCKF